MLECFKEQGKISSLLPPNVFGSGRLTIKLFLFTYFLISVVRQLNEYKIMPKAHFCLYILKKLFFSFIHSGNCLLVWVFRADRVKSKFTNLQQLI